MPPPSRPFPQFWDLINTVLSLLCGFFNLLASPTSWKSSSQRSTTTSCHPTHMSFPNTPVVPEFPVIYLNDKPITYDSNLEVIPKSPQPVETISRKPVAWVDLFPEQADELLAWQIIVGHKDAPLMSEIDFSECPSESLDDDDEFDSSFDSQKREGDGRSYFSDDSDDDEEETSIISIVPQTALEEVTLTRSEDDIARENQRLILLLEDYIKDLGIKNQRPKSFQFGPRSKFLKAKL